jgi:signal transduction histidine kinase
MLCMKIFVTKFEANKLHVSKTRMKNCATQYAKLFAVILGFCSLTQTWNGDIPMTNKTNNKEYSLEQILHATLYSIGDAVIATDKRGRVTLMNPVAEKSRRDERLVEESIIIVFHNPVGMNVW